MAIGQLHPFDVLLPAENVAENSAAVKGRAINSSTQTLTVTGNGHQQVSDCMISAVERQLRTTEQSLSEILQVHATAYHGCSLTLARGYEAAADN